MQTAAERAVIIVSYTIDFVWQEQKLVLQI
jgi:hypothetical protein